MWILISPDKFVKLHLEKNPNENEKVLRVRLEVLENESPHQGQKKLEQGSTLLNESNS
jgi:hypothetical protein